MAEKSKSKIKSEKAGAHPRLVLLDAHAILHRAYHALPDFSTAKGEPTGALYGLSTMLLKIIADLKPDYLAACYDLPGPTFRHEAYEDYKGKRVKTDDALIAQMNRSREIFTAFNIPIYEHPSFEADDMLGTIVSQLEGKDIDIIIASGDMDTMQLINNDKVRVYTLKKGINDTIIYNEKAVVERFGFKPILLPDYKGLRGDPSDNIIGIAGIGEKIATDLIVNFGSIENIYKKLKKDREVLLKAGIKERIVKLLEEGEEEALFSKELATIRRDAPIVYKLPEKTWREEFEVEKVTKLMAELEFRSLSARVRSIFSTVGGPASGGGGANGDSDAVEKFPEEKQIVDEEELKETGLALWVLNSNLTNPQLEDILQFGKTDDFKKAREIIFSELKKQKLEHIYNDIEKPLIPILKKMQEIGIKIDAEYLKKLSVEYHQKLSEIEKKIFKEAGEEFNINSPKQLGVVLFEKMLLGVKNQKKTGTGQKSTRESELVKMKDTHPVVNEILAYRELQKLLSTYIDNIPQMAGEDGRIHAEFIQSGSATGRFSSQNPNLQNIPIKSEQGRKIRHGFVASTNCFLVAFDYAQIELKVAAFLSKDEKLIDIFVRGEDSHTEVASRVFNVPPELVDKEMRRQAKVINFGILYGMGVNALKENLGTTRAEAQTFYNNYFATFSGLAHYLNQVKSEAARKGYTETYFGRRRYFEGINSKLPFIKSAAERMAINAPIQGTSADIIKMAMAQVDAYIQKENLQDKVYLLLQVHDELICEIEEGLVEKIAPEIQKIMENVIAPKDIFGIKLTTSFAKGKNWGSLY
ncbi:MAG: DNA polymerase [bacterium]|nr:DNA polymerase [bacterium]